MPTDSFESPLTLAACGGHVDLAMLLIERGANIEEVNDEGYTPLMEAAREGHEEMVALLLSQGKFIPQSFVFCVELCNVMISPVCHGSLVVYAVMVGFIMP
jgi:ankyrin repeat protein